MRGWVASGYSGSVRCESGAMGVYIEFGMRISRLHTVISWMMNILTANRAFAVSCPGHNCQDAPRGTDQVGLVSAVVL
jgi:hypothetical protein